MPAYKKLSREGDIYTVEFEASDGRTATKRFKGSEQEIDGILEEAAKHFESVERPVVEELDQKKVTVKLK